MSLAIGPARPEDGDSVRALALGHRFADNRFYRLFGFDFPAQHLADTAQRFLAGEPSAALLACAGGQALGFAGLGRLEWESAHFGIEMATVPFLFAEGDDAERLAIHTALFDGIEAAARECGILHVAVRVDFEDGVALRAAQAAGYRLMDALVTHLGDAERPPPSRPRSDPVLEVTTYRKQDLAQIPAHEIQPFEKFMREAYRIDRFHADPHLSSERADDVYVEWMRKVFSGEWADGMQVIRKEGRLVGFCSFQYAHELKEHYGVKILGRGLAGVLPEAKGGYSVLTEAVQTRCPFGSRFQEFDTQIQNFPTINVWIKHGMRYVRGRHTLHRWLGDEVRRAGSGRRRQRASLAAIRSG
jgi:hypothetical protein